MLKKLALLTKSNKPDNFGLVKDSNGEGARRGIRGAPVGGISGKKSFARIIVDTELLRLYSGLQSDPCKPVIEQRVIFMLL